MNYRLATILAREAHASDTTKVIDLNLSDPVSQIIISHEPYMATSGSPTAHPAGCITKIELVDGSDVLFSLTGKEAQAADWYHRMQEPANVLQYPPTLYGTEMFLMNFGRFLWDPLYAFDPRKFTNPQLKITIDVDGGGTNVTTGYLTVLAHLFDEKAVEPTGFFMHKEIKDYALAASAHEYTDLPNDYPYRKLFARIQKYGTGPEDCFSTVKLSEDNDKRIPYNHTIAEILRSIVGQGREYRETILSEGYIAGSWSYCTPTYRQVLLATQWRPTPSAALTSLFYGDGGRFWVRNQSATSNLWILSTGWCPHGVIELPFGLQDDPTDWYDVTKLGSLRLDILSASGVDSGDSCQIFLQQLRPY